MLPARCWKRLRMRISTLGGILGETLSMNADGDGAQPQLDLGLAGISPPRNEKACRGRRCGRLSERTEQRLGGGMPLFHQTSLGGGVGRLRYEALREEMHRFDRVHLSRILPFSKVLCCSAAMCDAHCEITLHGARRKHCQTRRQQRPLRRGGRLQILCRNVAVIS
ncbi:MAG: hypothetical protein JWM58_2824 [Rhizobium sp.]|nr:hypothetical protein [Rhizobium sp.]